MRSSIIVAVAAGLLLALTCGLTGPAAQARPSGLNQVFLPIILNLSPVAVAAGGDRTCALSSSGIVKCWGRIDSGIFFNPAPTDLGLGSGAAAFGVGFYHACVVISGAGVKCWGDNSAGQLGDGTTTTRDTPVNVVGLGSGVTTVTAGFQHTCALTSGGGIKCWGDNSLGQLGDGTTTAHHTPVDVVGLGSGVTAIAAGFQHTCALTAVGGVKCWGRGPSGELGNGVFSAYLATPVDVVGLTGGVASITMGGAHSCAVTTAGAAKCWGDSYYGQRGDGTTAAVPYPIDVVGLASGVKAMAAGGAHTCALTAGRGVKCWGRDDTGQVGNGAYSSSVLTPVDVVGLASGAVYLAAGNWHSCARISGGGIKCWGFDYYEQLGNGSAIYSINTPVDVVGLN